MAGLSYFNPDSPKSEKLQLFAIAAGFHIATTVYTLSVMAPYNRKLAALSKELNQGVLKGNEKAESQGKTAAQFREAQKIWKFRNYGRGAIMLAAVTASAIALST